VQVLNVPGVGTVARRTAVVLAVLGLVMTLVAVPALAHGEEADADPTDLVEQALAILVNTPEATGEALERVEAALAAETEQPSGALDVEALEAAAAALQAGELHDAEDALIEALGRDAHADEPKEPAGEQPAATTAPTTVAETPEPPPPAEPAEEPEHDDAETAAPAHGLTSRVEGGLTAPGPAETVALAVAVLLAVGGTVLIRGKE